MKKAIIFLIILPNIVFAWDFTQERAYIPVEFDSVQCQVPWTTGYNYINPTFCDLDADGDYDLVLGSDWKRTTLIINIGDSNCYSFEFETDSLVNLPEIEPQSQRPNSPIFCDIDDDGDYDLFVGAYVQNPVSFGRLFFYENIGTSQDPEFSLIEEFFQNIQCQTNQSPFFIDIDNDEDYDLFIGFGLPWTSPAGKLAFYENIGTSEEPVMDSITHYFMGIDLGYECNPAFGDIDNDGDYDMFLGDEDGLIHYYRNDGTPEIYDFTEVTSNYADVNVANIASPSFCDIDGDGDYDLFVGERSWGEDNRHGDINFYENTGTPDSAVFELVTQNFLAVDIGKHPSTLFADINNDGLLEMFIGDGDGNINCFSNIGTHNEPHFVLTEDVFQGIWATYQSRPDFGDMDNDGDLDLVVGRTGFSNSIHYYRNDGTPEDPNLIQVTTNLLGIDYQRPAPRLIDIDNDDDLDLFDGHWWNQVVYWKNEGTPESPNFILEDTNFLNTLYDGDFCPITFSDVDNDGDYDLLRGYSYGTLSFYRNAGTSVNPNIYLEEDNFLGIESVHQVEPFIVDIDNDNDMDLFVGDFCGGVSFWRNK